LATDARVHCAVLKQRPATHHPTRNRMSSLGPDQKDSHNRPYPQTPNNVPDTINPIPFSTPKQY
ncbi:hypothetical protein MJE76_31060, partial [Bacillus cereus]